MRAVHFHPSLHILNMALDIFVHHNYKENSKRFCRRKFEVQEGKNKKSAIKEPLSSYRPENDDSSRKDGCCKADGFSYGEWRFDFGEYISPITGSKQSKEDAGTVLHCGFVGGAIDPLHAPGSEPKPIRGDNRRCAPRDHLVSSSPPRVFSDLPFCLSLV
ncbi:hypothetical protein V6N11_039413 [Hibiscus sabdariffa]|uniref:Uncharacterized protein n=1 Tax=Hibiscus sabdariffa TaxID=183260 RepID=A0ABR2SMT0_9ROSI